MTKIKNLTLNNGVQIPQEGFGVYQIRDFAECKRSVKDALEVGYRMLDTAQIYGNENAVGQAIKESPVDRKEIFITTKVWLDNYGYDNTQKSIAKSLENLQTDYIDLVLLHQPYNDYYGAYRALEDLYDEGKIRAIGLSNFYPDRYLDLMHFNRIVPAVDQLETHIFTQRQSDQRYLEKYGTKLESWAPFAEGENGMFTNPILTKIGQTHDKTAAQVALRFLLQNDVIIIPKSTHKERMIENLAVWDFTLSASEMAEIRTLDSGKGLMMNHADPDTTAEMIGLK